MPAPPEGTQPHIIELTQPVEKTHVTSADPTDADNESSSEEECEVQPEPQRRTRTRAIKRPSRYLE